VVLQLTVFANNPTSEQYAAAQKGLNSSASASASATPSVSLPPVPNPSVAAGKTFTGTLTLNQQPLGVELNGTAAPQAAAVFKTLADANYFNQKPCHRLTTGDFAVLQCGALDIDGKSDPTFKWGPIENAPADNIYPAGTVAVARVGNDANSNGTQFFITYKDTTIPADSAGGYTVVGRLMPAEASLAQGCLPLGLAHGWKMLRPVPAGQPLKWSDVAFDANLPAVKLRREMERDFGPQLRSAA